MSSGVKKSTDHWVLIFALFLVLGVSACGDVQKRWDPLGYTVRKGDTLYSIAWRYEKDYREIAQWNNIQHPFAIYPGQRLMMQPVNQDGTVPVEERPALVEPDSQQQAAIEPVVSQAPLSVNKPKPSHVTVKKNDTLYSIARSEGFTHHQLARWNHLKPPYLLSPGQKLRLSPTLNAMGQTAQQPAVVTVTPPVQKSVVSAPLVQAKTARVVSQSNNELPTRVSKWHWPVKGRVVKTYKSNDTSRKGIGISGKSGQSINAAAGGTVVYSGNGLINYGNLVIIKHSHSFLSAYAHNKSLLVKEGDSVKLGQAIAKIGKNEAGKPLLHFEIRRNGKPVNPLNYLPKT